MAQSDQNTGVFGSMSEIKLNELRRMILGLDTEDLRRLALLVNDPEAFSEDISELLPNSIKLMLDKGKISYTVLIPIIESALKDSIKKDPKTVADILFPIMMPAIRKAVSEDLKKMIDSLNTTLEHGFSPKRLAWRFKAMFSGKSYAEIVLSHAYIYRVKQVFLIHKQSGILLKEISYIEDPSAKDADMVSSMLSAIKDFVQDSFDVEQKNELDTIKVGQFNIWIEQGPGALLAAIVEGNAPAGFRTILKETIEKIHLKQSYELENFKGDVDVFKKSDPYLQSCIVSEQKEVKKKKPVLIIILFLLLIGFGSYWAYISVEKKLRIHKLENALRAESGILITDYYNTNGKVVFEGMRDPLAKDPITISGLYNVDKSEAAFAFNFYISLDSSLILKRAYSILQPPKLVILSFKDGVLYATGESNNEWITSALHKYLYIPGVDKLNIENLNIPPNKEVVTNKAHIESKRPSIEKFYFVFKYNTIKINEKQKVKFNNFIDEVKSVYDFNFSQDSVPVIIVMAHTSYQGNAVANKKVAYERAIQFINLMIKEGTPMEVLVPKTDYIEDTDDNYPVRSISFKVTYSKPEKL